MLLPLSPPPPLLFLFFFNQEGPKETRCKATAAPPLSSLPFPFPIRRGGMTNACRIFLSRQRRFLTSFLIAQEDLATFLPLSSPLPFFFFFFLKIRAIRIGKRREAHAAAKSSVPLFLPLLLPPPFPRLEIVTRYLQQSQATWPAAFFSLPQRGREKSSEGFLDEIRLTCSFLSPSSFFFYLYCSEITKWLLLREMWCRLPFFPFPPSPFLSS